MKKEKKQETTIEEEDLKLCREHRKKIGSPSDRDFRQLRCDEGLYCHENCPVVDSIKKYGDPSPKLMTMTWHDEVTVDVKKAQKAEKTITVAVERFIDLQLRVLNKLSWHPEIYNLKVVASKATKKLFADMEKQIAKEEGDENGA